MLNYLVELIYRIKNLSYIKETLVATKSSEFEK